MISRRILVIGLAIFTVTFTTACPHDIVKSIAEQEQLRTEYNEKVHKLNAIDLELISYGVDLSGFRFLGLTNLNSKSAGDRAIIRAKLTQYLEIINRVIELSHHKALEDRVSDSARTLHADRMRAAMEYLKSLN